MYAHIQFYTLAYFRGKFTKFTGKQKREDTVHHSQVLAYFDKLVKPGKTGTGKGPTAFLPNKIKEVVKHLHKKFPNHVFGKLLSDGDDGDEGDEGESEGKDESASGESASG